MKTEKKSVFIETYGCQMNVYDTELIKSILEKNDYAFVNREQDADVVMLNTCSVRENANQKIYTRVHEIKKLKREQPVTIGILGCMATNLRKHLLDDAKLKIDFIAGPDSYKHLPNLIEQAQPGKKQSYHFSLSEFETYSDVTPVRQEGVNAWIAIMRGCNNYCSFCVVPHTRGRERSRAPENIVDEVKELVDKGFKQVTLLGQNVNSYQHEDCDFTELMDKVSQVDGIKRVRFTSPHPKDFPRKLLKLMAERETICKQIHLPLQAGNNRVLEMMNRTYTKEDYLTLVDEIRDLIPNIAISTDIICGFPSETEKEFEDTQDVVERVGYDSAFIFKYSERENTLASKRYKDDVSETEKGRRCNVLNTIQRQRSREINNQAIGQTHKVLIERVGTKKDPDELQGRNDANKVVILDKDAGQIGDIITVTIAGAGPNSLRGKVLI